MNQAQKKFILVIFCATIFYCANQASADMGALLDRPNQVVVQGNYAYVVSDLSNSLEIVDISNPAYPKHAGGTAPGDPGVELFAPKSLDVSGNYAYVVSYSNDLEIFDVSDPANPEHVSTLHNGDTGAAIIRPVFIRVVGNYAYIAVRGSHNITIVDVSDPNNPANVSSIFVGLTPNPTSLFVLGDYLYFTTEFPGGGTMYIYDVSNPASIVFKGSIQHGNDGASIDNPTSIFVSGNYAYITSYGGNSLEVVDVADPTLPTHAGVIYDGDGGANLEVPFSVFVNGDYAYLATYQGSGLEIVDISDPASPVHAGKIDDGDGGAVLSYNTSVDVQGNYAYVTSSLSNALEIVDISDPANPTHVGVLKNGEIGGPPPGCTVDCFSNVLFLPGLKASRLYEQTGGSEEKLWEPSGNGDLVDLYLNPDGTSINEVYTRDIIEELPVLGQNIYKSFSDTMDQLVLEEKINDWESYAYDWRQSVDDIVNNGTKDQNGTVSLIDTLQSLVGTESKNGKVTIVAHSNGGLLAKALLKKLQDDKTAGLNNLIDDVDVLILVGVPQIGTAMAVPAMLHGYGEEILKGFIVDRLHARELGRNMTSGYALLPSREYINRVSASPVTFVDNALPSGITTDMVQTYGNVIDSYSEYKDFLFGAEGRVNPTPTQTELPINLSESLFSQTESLHNNIDAFTPPASLQVIEVAGWGLDTLASFEYYPKVSCISFPCSFVLDQRPRWTADGDGTVVVPSAQYVGFTGNAEKYWLNILNYNKDNSKNYEHKNILEISPLLDFISDTITGDLAVSSYFETTEPVDPLNRFRISIHSPITLDAYNSEGNHTGKICEPGSGFCQIEENIPNSSYLEFGEGKYLNLPEEEMAKIVIKGTGAGTFTYESEEVESDVTTVITTFEDIPVTPETIGEVTLNEDSSLTLTLDEDGDGIVDDTLEALPGSTVSIDTTPPELKVTFNINSKDVTFSALDTQDPSPNLVKTNTSITLTDNSGNVTVVPLNKLREVPTRLRLAYNKIIRNGTVIQLPNTNIIYDWKEKNGVLTDLDTRVVIKGVEKNVFNYRKASNTTVIREKLAGNKVSITTRPGFVSVTVQTEGDSLKVSY